MTAVMNTGAVVLRQAASAWKYLNGIVCIYKPPEVSMKKVIRDVKHKLCEDLNSMERLPRKNIVSFRRVVEGSVQNGPQPDLKEKILYQVNDGEGTIQVIESLNYADHPLVLGPGYEPENIKVNVASAPMKNASGVAVIGINGGCYTAELIFHNKWLKTYVVSGQFGKATDSFFRTGKVIERATYGSIKKHMLDRMLASSQATFQRMAFQAAGVPLDSERAYELASQGLVRPEGKSNPLMYSVKCIKFDLPDFELEINCINEKEEFLSQFVHDLGIKLHSVAVCTKIRCVKVGPFNIDLALLGRHWNLEGVLSNIGVTSKILSEFNLRERDPLI